MSCRRSSGVKRTLGEVKLVRLPPPTMTPRPSPGSWRNPYHSRRASAACHRVRGTRCAWMSMVFMSALLRPLILSRSPPRRSEVASSWAFGRRSSPHGHLCRVRARQRERAEVLRGVRRSAGRAMRRLWRRQSPRAEVLRGVRPPADLPRRSLRPALQLAAGLHAEASGRAHPHVEDRRRGRAQAGDRPLRRHEGLDGAHRRARSRRRRGRSSTR